MVFFSTIIPVFNRSDLVVETLESVFNQEFSDQEIIVVDDGSTDGTLQVLAKYSDHIKLLQQENKGPGEARNLGIYHAQGQYIVFLDSDDLWLPWALSTYREIVDKYNFPSFIAGNAVYFSNKLELSSLQPQFIKSECFADYYATSTEALPFLTSAVAVRRTVIQAVGGFTTQKINAEDNDLWLKLGIAEKFVYIHAPVVLGYRQHENSAVADITKTYQGACYIIKQEQEELYPGKQERLIQRLQILTCHIRPVSLACLKQKQLLRALYLYQKTFNWNFKLQRLRYLIVFPILFIIASLKKFYIAILNQL